MLTYPLVLLSKPVNPMNKVNAKITLLFKFSSYSFSHFKNGISRCFLFGALSCFPLQFLIARLRFAPPLQSGIFSAIRARIEVGSINDSQKKTFSKEQKSEQQKTKSAGKNSDTYIIYLIPFLNLNFNLNLNLSLNFNLINPCFSVKSIPKAEQAF